VAIEAKTQVFLSITSTKNRRWVGTNSLRRETPCIEYRG